MSDFVEKYGGIYEHSPWVAEQSEPVLGDSEDIEEVARVMADCVDNAGKDQQLALIRAHPDLAGKAQIAGELTEDSTAEQSSAGLDQCSPEEYLRFQDMNQAYHLRFGFPFVMAVRNSTRAQILDAFEERLGNDRDVEFETALAEIHKIARLRLETMEAES
jgi:OHCU decarboxylase